MYPHPDEGHIGKKTVRSKIKKILNFAASNMINCWMCLPNFVKKWHPRNSRQEKKTKSHFQVLRTFFWTHGPHTCFYVEGSSNVIYWWNLEEPHTFDHFLCREISDILNGAFGSLPKKNSAVVHPGVTTPFSFLNWLILKKIAVDWD